MYVTQLYTNCLAHAAYYIESGKQAAIVDPLRNPEPYITLAKERGATIKYVLETHFHADFVSGHLDLANKTGATIVFGPDAIPDYKAYIADDGELLPLGNAQIEVLHTPGHTIESACYLLRDEANQAHALFSGDTLFIGDVGRPDLLSGNLDKEALAAMMFHSLNTKIKTLPNDVIVYPGHGAGSACGKNIGKESQSTIGREKQLNYALKIEDKDAFITTLTTDLPSIPGYFFSDAIKNKGGYSGFDEILKNSLKALTVANFMELHTQGATIIDTRDAMDFAAGFISGSINIGLNGDFAVWVGTLIPPNSQILLVTDEGKEREAIERLARIGYDHVMGYLGGGITTWFASQQAYENILTFEGRALQGIVDDAAYGIVDVRNRKEAAHDRITGAQHLPLNQLADTYPSLDADGKWLIYCAGGYRSMIAASFLRSKGYHFVASLEGGINNLRTKLPELIEVGQETE